MGEKPKPRPKSPPAPLPCRGSTIFVYKVRKYEDREPVGEWVKRAGGGCSGGCNSGNCDSTTPQQILADKRLYKLYCAFLGEEQVEVLKNPTEGALFSSPCRCM